MISGFVDSLWVLLNTKNNSVESFNGQLKTDWTSQFIDGFFTVLYALGNERDYRVAKSVTKHVVHSHPLDTAGTKYLQLLTTHSAGFVWKQLELMKKVGNKVSLNEKEFSVQNSSYCTTESSCTCGFYKSLKFPCRHIFALWHYLNVPLYHPLLCFERWKMSYYRQNQRAFQNSVLLSSSKTLSTHINVNRKERILTKNEKFRRTSSLSMEIM